MAPLEDPPEPYTPIILEDPPEPLLLEDPTEPTSSLLSNEPVVKLADFEKDIPRSPTAEQEAEYDPLKVVDRTQPASEPDTDKFPIVAEIAQDLTELVKNAAQHETEEAIPGLSYSDMDIPGLSFI